MMPRLRLVLAALLCAVSRPALAATADASLDLPSSVLQTVLVLVGVCALAAVTLRLYARRFGATGPTAPMRVLGRLALEPRRSLVVVRVVGRTLLLSSSEAGVSAIGELTPAEARAFEPRPDDANVSRETPEGA